MPQPGVDTSRKDLLAQLLNAQALLSQRPYCLTLRIDVAQEYLRLEYPDLAAGEAYKALLLSDAYQDESDEYHEVAVAAIHNVIAGSSSGEQCEGFNDAQTQSGVDGELSDAEQYEILIRSLVLCDCFATAFSYYLQATRLHPKNLRLQQFRTEIEQAVAKHFHTTPETLRNSDQYDPTRWLDHGYVRREIYPWNHLEPNRLEDLPHLNEMMTKVAPKLQVSAVNLPAMIDGAGSNEDDVVRQLGVFAREDICPGETLLDETSLLTANNKLQDALCDACSADLPELDSERAETTVSCQECNVVFCSKKCYDDAMQQYHPALCGTDIEAIAKDVPADQAANSLYSLLLLRTFAMAQTQQCHPLELKEVKYIWGDFQDLSSEDDRFPEEEADSESHCLPKTLPFSFEYSIRLPFHMLEKMDIDIYANPQYDVWVFNTLYAKFRGTASARLSGFGGRKITGPEVSAVHPMWCLANHSCDPNVSWEWGGSIKFWAREERVAWRKNGIEVKRSKAGIRKGEEILNHYCDVELPVPERRNWARGALGGCCRCERCIFEEQEVE